jgi:hypothetical protein
MRRSLHTPLAILLAGLLAPAFAAEPPAPPSSADQQAMMAAWQKAATPGAQHAQLAEHFQGAWTTRMSIWMEPGAEPVTETGTATFEPVLGGRQLRMYYKGSFMGMPMEGVGLSGYDNTRARYTSVWNDNMSTSTMVSTGDYDPATRTYTYVGEMADPMKDGKLMAVRETIRIVDAAHFVMEMFEAHDGEEVRTMQIEYARGGD